MSSREEAENVIRNIRKSRHADDLGGVKSDANARTLSRALDMLSSQLYTKPTHFILELIQNADDNKYASTVNPLLTLVYREDGYLWIGCNEIGFTQANIEAICDIADSTKKIEDHTKGYIGEKGIGFKSVFSVADMVWIKSGNYTFRFDRNSALGMIVPIWSDFKSTNLMSERTMFCLRIPDPDDRQRVSANLLALKAELLLFLSKLKKIDVKIYQAGATDASHGCTIHSNLSGRIIRSKYESLSPPIRNYSESYYRHQIKAQNMPPEVKREGVTESYLVMALPNPLVKHLPDKPVYNFLPIRSYGFPFLLHADFILTSNREDIIQENLWNKRLVQTAIELFVVCVKSLYPGESSRYRWPRFLASSNVARGTIMENFIEDLSLQLQKEKVLENMAGDLCRPSDLLIVPRHFTYEDDFSTPLFNEPDLRTRYVQPHYSPGDLKTLSVKFQTAAQVAQLLKAMSYEELKNKAPSWHAGLAAGIVKEGTERFKSAKLIPLRNGEWVSATTYDVFYFPNSGVDMDVPDGIEVRVISDIASANEARRKMFHLFGAQPLAQSESQVCQLILKRHKQGFSSPPPIEWMLSHVWYLFQHGNSTTMDHSVLQLLSRSLKMAKARELYMDLPDSSYRMSDHFSDSAPCDFVHPEYLTYGDHDPRWHGWLHQTLGVRTLPRLWHFGGISEEFRHLFDSAPSIVWLSLLRDNWSNYEADVGPVSNKIASAQVKCKYERSCKLEDAYLATITISRVPLSSENICIIDVPDPQDVGWLNLARLGLRTKPDLNFYLTILRGVPSSDLRRYNKDILLKLYNGIEEHFGENRERVENAFAKEKLVGITDGFSFQWLGLNECRWKAASCPLSITPLSDHFPDQKGLFVTLLGVKDANAADVLDELLTLSTATAGRSRVKSLLLALSGYFLKSPHLDEHFQQLADKEIVPVRASDGKEIFSTFTNQEWFIPDRHRLFECFKGRVSILDFHQEELDRLGPILSRMNLRVHCLSEHVQTETSVTAESRFHSALTLQLQEKAKYISLLHSEQKRQTDTLVRMGALQIWTSAGLVLRRWVTVDGHQIPGREEKCRAMIRKIENSTRLYCYSEDPVYTKPSWHFICDELIGLLRIGEEKKALLQSILTCSDHEEIEDILERVNLLGHSSLASLNQHWFEESAEEEADGDAEERNDSAQPPWKARVSTPSRSIRNRSQATSPSGLENPRYPSNRTVSGQSNNRRDLIIDVVTKAAESCNMDKISVLAAADTETMQHLESQISVASMPLLSTPNFRRSRAVDNSSGASFNMQELRSALLDTRLANVPDIRGTAVPGDREKDIGYGGELFVFKLLERICGATLMCWTSKMRSNYGFLPFSKPEGLYSDFTITDPEVAARLTNWLTTRNYDGATGLREKVITYHLEVKTTMGACSEPFIMSSNQMILAQKWHESSSDVYMIFRVYEVASKAAVKVYVDPFALEAAGKLKFAAHRGYSVQPA